MSKKMNKLVLLSALMIAIIGTIGTVSAEGTFNLIADGGNVETAFPVGVVEVTDDGNNLTVTYTTTNGWLLNETHLHIANESEYIPQTKKGNPQPGQFDYSEEHEPCVEYTYVVPLIDIDISDEGTVCIAAHAAVELPPQGEEEEIRYESAWGEGEGEDFEGKNWAMYFTYTIEEPE